MKVVPSRRRLALIVSCTDMDRSERFYCDVLLAMYLVIAALCLASPIFILSALWLLRPDPGLVGVGGALGACAALGAAAMLAAGTMRLPRETLVTMESLWLEGALDVLAVEVCAVAFLLGARAAVHASGTSPCHSSSR